LQVTGERQRQFNREDSVILERAQLRLCLFCCLINGKRPALQVEQVKTGCFEAIYEDTVWKSKPNSNDQNPKIVVE
jgi:hypothetical protein